MAIDVEINRKAVSGEGPGEQIEMAEEVFAGLEPIGGNDAAVISDEFEQRGLARTSDEPSEGRGIVLPKGADLCHLPATNRLVPGLDGPDGFKARAKAKRRMVARSRLIPKRRSSSQAEKPRAVCAIGRWPARKDRYVDCRPRGRATKSGLGAGPRPEGSCATSERSGAG